MPDGGRREVKAECLPLDAKPREAGAREDESGLGSDSDLVHDFLQGVWVDRTVRERDSPPAYTWEMAECKPYLLRR